MGGFCQVAEFHLGLFAAKESGPSIVKFNITWEGLDLMIPEEKENVKYIFYQFEFQP